MNRPSAACVEAELSLATLNKQTECRALGRELACGPDHRGLRFGGTSTGLASTIGAASHPYQAPDRCVPAGRAPCARPVVRPCLVMDWEVGGGLERCRGPSLAFGMTNLEGWVRVRPEGRPGGRGADWKVGATLVEGRGGYGGAGRVRLRRRVPGRRPAPTGSIITAEGPEGCQ